MLRYFSIFCAIVDNLLGHLKTVEFGALAVGLEYRTIYDVSVVFYDSGVSVSSTQVLGMNHI